uniref:Secreted protein n=1 Tax=Angiostrongylus cantonensis TaxID=6313 RepID=A0A0K0DQX0_ANGCA
MPGRWWILGTLAHFWFVFLMEPPDYCSAWEKPADGMNPPLYIALRHTATPPRHDEAINCQEDAPYAFKKCKQLTSGVKVSKSRPPRALDLRRTYGTYRKISVVA